VFPRQAFIEIILGEPGELLIHPEIEQDCGWRHPVYVVVDLDSRTITDRVKLRAIFVHCWIGVPEAGQGKSPRLRDRHGERLYGLWCRLAE
jgi:hypothetical protein